MTLITMPAGLLEDQLQDNSASEPKIARARGWRWHSSRMAVVVLQGRTSEILWANKEAERLLGMPGRHHLVSMNQREKDRAIWLMTMHRLACGLSGHERLSVQLSTADDDSSTTLSPSTIMLTLFLLQKGQKGEGGGPEILGIINTCHISSTCTAEHHRSALQCTANVSCCRRLSLEARGEKRNKVQGKQPLSTDSHLSSSGYESWQHVSSPWMGTEPTHHWPSQVSHTAVPHDSATSACFLQPITSLRVPRSPSKVTNHLSSFPAKIGPEKALEADTSKAGSPPRAGFHHPNAFLAAASPGPSVWSQCSRWHTRATTNTALVYPRSSSSPGGVAPSESDASDSVRCTTTQPMPGRLWFGKFPGRSKNPAGVNVLGAGSEHGNRVSGKADGTKDLTSAADSSAEARQYAQGNCTRGNLIRHDSLPIGSSCSVLLSGVGGVSSWKAAEVPEVPPLPGLPSLMETEHSGPHKFCAVSKAGTRNSSIPLGGPGGFFPSVDPVASEEPSTAAADCVSSLPRPFLPSKSMPVERSEQREIVGLGFPKFSRASTHLRERACLVPHTVPQMSEDASWQLSTSSGPGGAVLDESVDMDVCGKKSPLRRLLQVFLSKDKKPVY